MPKIPEEMFDVRKLDRFVAEGILSRADVDAHLESLEDCAADADQSSVLMIGHARHRGDGSGDGSHEDDEG